MYAHNIIMNENCLLSLEWNMFKKSQISLLYQFHIMYKSITSMDVSVCIFYIIGSDKN